MKTIVDKIKNSGGEAVYAVTDVTNIEDNKNLVDKAKAQFGRIDVIFLNAGLMPNSPLSKLKSDEWHDMVDVNIKGVLNGIEAALPEFIKQKSDMLLLLHLLQA